MRRRSPSAPRSTPGRWWRRARGRPPTKPWCRPPRPWQGSARLGGENGPGLETGKFLAPHGIALDSKGDIYVGEVGVTNWKTSFPDTPMPAVVRCLQKLEKI